ncbi:MAG: 23S rRNA (guanosine(2251)-2'-O)-methyltransferase RlmB [Lachnospiraceae bacterium]|nr:23S rRNA (guanosine(2251)-2'-O)-methyltransferase RlmB [Lachnospiraceae bacterium]
MDEEKRDESLVFGRNAVLALFRAGTTVEKLYVQDGLKDGPIRTILREAKKTDTVVRFLPKERLTEMAKDRAHQGVIALAGAGTYVEMDELFRIAEERGEPPFFFLLDEVQDPHNLGAILRTAHVAGAHGIILPKVRSALLTPAAVKASAGAASFVPVVKTGNLVQTIEELKKRGLWFVCGDMNGTSMYELDLTGPMVLVLGNEGNGVSRLVKEHCDYAAAIPMHGELGSLNVSVACGVLGYEIVRQRRLKNEWK